MGRSGDAGTGQRISALGGGVGDWGGGVMEFSIYRQIDVVTTICKSQTEISRGPSVVEAFGGTCDGGDSDERAGADPAAGDVQRQLFR